MGTYLPRAFSSYTEKKKITIPVQKIPPMQYFLLLVLDSFSIPILKEYCNFFSVQLKLTVELDLGRSTQNKLGISIK